MSWRWSVFCLAVIVCVGLIVYQPALRMGFWTTILRFSISAVASGFRRLAGAPILTEAVQWLLVSTDARVRCGGSRIICFAPMRPASGVSTRIASDKRRIVVLSVGEDRSRRWRLGLIAVVLVYVALSTHALAVFWSASPIRWSACSICLRLRFGCVSRIESRALVCIRVYRICRHTVK